MNDESKTPAEEAILDGIDRRAKSDLKPPKSENWKPVTQMLGHSYFERTDLKRAQQSRVVNRVDKDGNRVERPQGWDVARWPEFIALAKRLGINLELPFEDLVIEIPCQGLVKIYQSYQADDIDQQNAVTPFTAVETTNQHNGVFNTYQPNHLKPASKHDEGSNESA